MSEAFFRHCWPSCVSAEVKDDRRISAVTSVGFDLKVDLPVVHVPLDLAFIHRVKWDMSRLKYIEIQET